MSPFASGVASGFNSFGAVKAEVLLLDVPKERVGAAVDGAIVLEIGGRLVVEVGLTLPNPVKEVELAALKPKLGVEAVVVEPKPGVAAEPKAGVFDDSDADAAAGVVEAPNNGAEVPNNGAAAPVAFAPKPPKPPKPPIAGFGVVD